jgi:hypothetical protein
MGTWCGVPCYKCDERFSCYKIESECVIEVTPDESYDELHDVLEDDYSEDSTP